MHDRPAYSQFDEYTGAVNRILKEIDRLSKNDLRSSEAHIRDFVSWTPCLAPSHQRCMANVRKRDTLQSKLVDLATRNLVSLMLKICREAAEQSPDMEGIVRSGQ